MRIDDPPPTNDDPNVNGDDSDWPKHRQRRPVEFFEDARQETRGRADRQ